MKTTNNISELVFILDRSGSMAGMESDTVGGFNSTLEKQKKESGDAYITTVLFSNDSVRVHDRVNISEVKNMSTSDFCVGGCTALIDAIGGTIEHIEKIHKYIRKEDIPQSTVFVIMTDGMENASHIYTSDRVKKMIEEKKAECGWEFLFMGANIDAVETAKHFGIDEDRAVTYTCDSVGTQMNFCCASQAISDVRAGAPLKRSWKKKIEDRKK